MMVASVLRAGRLTRRKVAVARASSYSYSTATATDAGADKGEEPLVVTSTVNGVRTVRMNNPRRLNAWNLKMHSLLFGAMEAAATDSDVKALIVTGTGRYYCAGVDLSEQFIKAISEGHPGKMYEYVRDNNETLFKKWIDFPKPIVVSANGPIFGASLTSATLCDRFICSDTAEFSTPFNRAAITPEGCSSYNWPTRLGVRAAERMLTEDWKPNAKEALEIGLVHEVVQGEQAKLQSRAQEIAEELIHTGYQRKSDPKWSEVNRTESHDLGKSFMSARFLKAQVDFLASKGKGGPSWAMWGALVTRPLWSNLLPPNVK